MKPNRQKKAHSSFTLREALNEFNSASNQKCKGSTAKASDVLLLASKACSQQSSFLVKAGPCLLSMEYFASFLDTGLTPQEQQPSALVWGCLKHLLTAASRSPIYLQKVADMFHSIGDFGDPKIRECSTSIFTTPRVHQKISLLYVRTLLCCARAMQAMSRKRERFRSLIPESLIKPFDFRYDVSLSKFQQHRDEFLAEAHQARFMQRAESIFRGMDEDALDREDDGREIDKTNVVILVLLCAIDT
ncbi:hypothetical protein BDV37DRAFT_281063 [Aspergillus pseudonomiae]|uniref:DUF7708 domain-containing protein n=1 Tax=Aspergillus pseudonomiae TaxID=1506151 RepID=A0A5N7DI84_9EURO|nr:uncharacterized protein BDV37DRAFT_281063 [Aspergillus pseudonomiae]KAE8406150.1 hypothetical protein BDV37DRAFT_281063 [Aspergillus pseudonomiae]